MARTTSRLGIFLSSSALALSCQTPSGAPTARQQALAAPETPVITEPSVDGKLVNAADVHMESGPFSDPDGAAHACTDWEIWTVTPQERVWVTPCIGGVERVHTHLGDGLFEGSHAGRRELLPETDYRLRVRHKDASGDPATEWSGFAERTFRTAANRTPVAGGQWRVLEDGYVVEEVAGGFQLPVNIAFTPNGSGLAGAPLFYVTELYGAVKVVKGDYTVSDYATGLLNFDPGGAFPGSGEQGVSGIAVDPTSGDVFVGLLYDAGGPHYPRVIRLHSTDGGLTAAAQTTVLDMVGEPQGQSHQISNLSIGPDGKLYVHMGDGFDAGTGQNLDSFRGKVLRVNLDGSAPTDNPFYDATDGIGARDYVFAYGLRNPFGGGWRLSDGRHYQVENGPSVDRFSAVDRGVNYGWNGTDASMYTGAIYNWSPARAPVNVAFVEHDLFHGSGFPAAKMGRAYVSESGPTWASGPQDAKRVSEFVISPEGTLVSGPTPLVEYNGTGKSTVVALAAGPDGLYFSTLYKDDDFADPTARGAQILRVRYTGSGHEHGAGSGLLGEYFDEPGFAGSPVTRVDERIAFDWGGGSPAPGIAADTFSVRWSGQIEAGETETVTFHATSDDGFRLWVGGQLLIDEWNDHGPTEHTGSIPLVAGRRYDIRVEMYENGGGAVARLEWSSPSRPREIVPAGQLYPANTPGLLGEYFDEPGFAGTRVARTDGPVSFDWQYGAPAAGIGPDTFSVRWTGQLQAPTAGSYVFHTTSDDGIRLWVGGQLVIDQWNDHAPTEHQGTVTLGAGWHDVRMEFYENGGGALARLEWAPPGEGRAAVPIERLRSVAP